MHIQEHQIGDLTALQQRITQEKQAEQRDRYRVVWLALQGQETKAIQIMLGRSRGFVQRWAYAYRDGGLQALTPARRGGSQPRLTPEQTQAFVERFTAGPTPADGVCTLRGQDAVRILAQEFGVHYSLNGVYQLLRRYNLSCLKPRPRHPKNDEQAMGQWRQNAPLLSRACVSDKTSTSRSRSGIRTKRGSASRAR